MPISFRYREHKSEEFLPEWQGEWVSAPSAGRVTQHTVTLTDGDTGLQCRCEIAAYTDYPAVEWVAYFRNTGSTDTPIISDIQALDARFPLAADRPCELHYAKGSQSQADDFAPLKVALPPDGSSALFAWGGRSSSGTLPFFNIALDNEGVVGAIGWSGGWQASFSRDDSGLHISAGMRSTHLKLHPGEEIRMPRILLLFWQGDPVDGQNLLRRFILAHHTPRPNGQLLQVPIVDSGWGERRIEDQIARARWLKDNDLPVEYLWVDAGWYGDAPYDPNSDTFGDTWYRQAGNWYPSREIYPEGLKPLGDALREMGLGFTLWVEPERVYPETQLACEHPEWLLSVPGDASYLFNLGNPEARRFLTDRISALIAEAGVTCYRQDFNMEPAGAWQAADAPDRVGMSEIRHIEGLYAFWDELLARHPGLIIDNCASGGRRIDLETISRSVPLWRSDVQCSLDFNPIAMQTQTQGLAPWVPLSAGCCRSPDRYSFRSALGPGMVVIWTTRALEERVDFPERLPLARELLAELLRVRPYFYGDFYPLVPFSLSAKAWTAWQLHRPDMGEGLVLALRRPQSEQTRLESPLHGLDPSARYELQNADTGEVTVASGSELLEKGVCIDIAERPGSALVLYRQVG
ncbi:MAG: alpha-galactosidase [Anaerolineae bacterium]|nr:alpha-galactosidase [Anaerolineae bacterium]